VETHIYRLRRKLEPTAESPRVLINHAGGYCLIAGHQAATTHRWEARHQVVELAAAG
jgi:hypothetical protein